MTIETYPTLKRAALEIAYDNGSIHRERTEEEYLAKCDEVINTAKLTPEALSAYDVWLAALTDEEMETATAGEHNDMEALMKNAPAILDKLLTAFFEEGWYE